MENDLPPHATTPPPLNPPPSAPPPRFGSSPLPPKKGRGWMVLALILLVLLGLSALLNFSHLIGSLATAGAEHNPGPHLEEVTIEDKDAHDKIAVIRVEGVITGERDNGYDLVELVREQLRRAEADSKVKAVVLKVNSPGGEVLASDEIYNAIADFQTGTDGKPVVCSMGSLAASGGYYISAPCRWIVANELTLTGSIGVIMHGYNYRGLMDKIGLRREVYKSGKFKDMLSPDRSDAEVPPEERAMVQALIDETYGKFKSIVAEGRATAHKLNGKEGQALVANWADSADGRVVSGKEALRLGLVDELGDFDTAVDKALDLAGLDKANLIEYAPRHDLADLLRLFGKSDARTLKVDLGVEFPKLQAGYLYFLAPTFIR